MTRVAVGLFLLLTACTTNAPSKVTAATLDSGLQFNLGVFWGFSVGLAGIGLDYADGTSSATTVLLVDGYQGFLLDVSLSFQGGEMTVPTGGVDRGDLFAPYSGGMWGAAVGIGLRREHMSNRFGVSIDTSEFTIGLTGFKGEQTMYVFPLWSK
jgi:hypothetical protein